MTRVVIAISPGDHRFAQLPLANHPQITVVDGGNERADSVLAGLQAVAKAQWVLVHDAARPCLHQDDLARLLAISEKQPGRRYPRQSGARHHETRRTGEERYCPYRRARRFMARAHPAVFPRELLYDCLTRALNEGATITDEASALEYCGFHPALVEGRADNIKVTRPEDLALAEFYLTRTIHREKA